MSAPLHRTVCQLTGEQRGPSKFFQANAAADERLAELEELRALRDETPEWKQIAHKLDALSRRYFHRATDEDQRAALANLSELMWLCTKYAAAVSGELHHWAAAADESDDKARDLEDELDVLRDSDIGEVQARNQELFEDNGRLRARVARLETQLAQARNERDTATAAGGVL